MKIQEQIKKRLNILGWITFSIGAVFLLVTVLICWEQKNNNIQDEGILKSKISGQVKKIGDMELELKKLNSKIDGLENQKTELENEKTTLEEELKQSNNSIRHCVDGNKTYNEQLRAQLWELQGRLMLSRKQGSSASRQLKKLWPIMEKQMPGWIKLWKEAIPGFNPDDFLSYEYNPEPYETYQPKKGVRQTGGFLESFDSVEWMFKQCIWSPDKKKCVWTCLASCDIDSEVLFLDLDSKLYHRLSFCSAMCVFEEVAWLDNETFVVVSHESDYINKQEKVIPRIRVYKASKEVIPSLIGAHIGPGVDSTKLDMADYRKYRLKRLRSLGITVTPDY